MKYTWQMLDVPYDTQDLARFLLIHHISFLCALLALKELDNED